MQKSEILLNQRVKTSKDLIFYSIEGACKD